MSNPTNPTNPNNAMPTREQLESVLHAALGLLAARHDRMVTIDEWTELARAVAVCQGRKTIEFFADSDLDAISERASMDWDNATDGLIDVQDE
jgi:hypothetical protein